MTNQNRAYIFAIIAILFWSTIASAFKITLLELDYFQLLFIASIFSCVVLFIIIAFQGKIHLILKSKKQDYYNSAFLGFLNPFLYYLVLLKAYTLLKAQEAGTLNYIWPITLVLLSIPLLASANTNLERHRSWFRISSVAKTTIPENILLFLIALSPYARK